MRMTKQTSNMKLNSYKDIDPAKTRRSLELGYPVNHAKEIVLSTVVNGMVGDSVTLTPRTALRLGEDMIALANGMLQESAEAPKWNEQTWNRIVCPNCKSLHHPYDGCY